MGQGRAMTHWCNPQRWPRGSLHRCRLLPTLRPTPTPSLCIFPAQHSHIATEEHVAEICCLVSDFEAESLPNDDMPVIEYEIERVGTTAGGDPMTTTGAVPLQPIQAEEANTGQEPAYPIAKAGTQHTMRGQTSCPLAPLTSWRRSAADRRRRVSSSACHEAKHAMHGD